MAAYNIDFVLARSTGQALAELRQRQFDAIISDMGRPPDSRSRLHSAGSGTRQRGSDSLFHLRWVKGSAHVREARSRGAQGTTNRGAELLQMLLEALNV